MKILLIGSGAREHALAEAFKRSPQCDALIVYGATMNPGIRNLADAYRVGSLKDMAAIKAFAAEYEPDFAFVGPENPLADGVVDELATVGVPSASPTKAMAQLESSKSFTRGLLQKYNIPGNPDFRAFTSEDGMMDYTRKLGQIVVKADGLHGGKGVLVQGDHFDTLQEGVAAAMKFIESDGQAVIEEKLVGQEFSLISFVDGEHVADTFPVQDHKRAFTGDTGPNTGGMGTYSYPGNLPFLTDVDVAAAHEITVKVAAAIKAELGVPFKGIMYGGFIAVKNGVRLIEYNARFGDPEAMNILPLLKSDLVTICRAIMDGTLDRVPVAFEKKATVCKYVVPQGYPENPVKDKEIRIGNEAMPTGVKTYFSAVDERNGKLVMTGSRAIAFTGIGDTIQEAEQSAQRAAEAVEGPVFYRQDIGTKALITKRVEMMKELRG